MAAQTGFLMVDQLDALMADLLVLGKADLLETARAVHSVLQTADQKEAWMVGSLGAARVERRAS